MAAGTITLTSATFDEIVNSSTTPILVDFWAEWCGPCKQIAPMLEELAVEQAGRVTIAKVDIEEFPELGARFSITGIPALFLFDKGELKKKFGPMSKSRMLSEIEPFLPIS